MINDLLIKTITCFIPKQISGFFNKLSWINESILIKTHSIKTHSIRHSVTWWYNNVISKVIQTVRYNVPVLLNYILQFLEDHSANQIQGLKLKIACHFRSLLSEELCNLYAYWCTNCFLNCLFRKSWKCLINSM